MNARSHVRILLVEDNPGDVALVRKRLDEGFAIRTAGRLSEAVDSLRTGMFDVVLLDLNLPDSEGLDTLMAIRRADVSVPIVVLTGAAVDTVGGEALLAGAPEFVDKNELDDAALRRILRQAVERRHLQAHIYQTMWEQADPTVVLDLEGHVQSANPAAAELLERPVADLVGFRLDVPDRSGTTELRLADGAGGAKHLVVRASYTTWDARPALLAMLQDVTAARRVKALELSKQESEGRLRLLMELLPVALWTTDEDFYITSITGFGLGTDPIVGTNLHALFEASGEELSDAMTLAVMAGEARFEARRGQRVYEGLIRRAGALDGYLGMVFDITDRRRLENQLRHSQKMEAVGRLAGGVAHDFNNMLTAIFSFAAFADESLGADHPARKDIGEVILAAERARDLTRQMLTFSRSHSSQPQIVDVNEAVHQIQNMLGRTLGEDIDLRVVAGEDLWRTRIDPGRLHQVVVNLCVNARDALPTGGTLVIDTTNVTLDESYTRDHPDLRPGDYVQLAVTDNGTGMAEEVARQAFDPFFTTKEQGKGTGLGLSTCYGIVAQAGGAIAVYSEPGFGTTMKVYLPRVGDQPTLRLRSARPAPAGGVETLLVVEDNDQVLRLVVRALEARGYRVLCARDGEEGIRVFQRRTGDIQLLLTDIVLPGMSGPEVAERLVAEHPGLRVLYMSGYTRAALDAANAMQGVNLLHKPFTPNDLAQQVREVLDDDSDTYS